MPERIPLQKTNTTGIYKRIGVKKTTYTVIIAIGTDDRGNPIQQRETFPTFPEAKKWQTRVLHERNAKTYVEPSKKPLGDFLKEWVIDQRGRVKPVTVLIYRQALERWQSIHHIPLNALEPDHVQRAMRDMKKAELAPSTIAQSYKKLRQALKDAVRLRLLPSSPLEEMRTPREEHVDPISLDEEEVDRFRDAIIGNPHRALFETAIETGMRFAELAALRWEYVDLIDASIRVVENVSRTEDAKRTIGTPKSKKGVREISLSDELVILLIAHRAVIAGHRQDDPMWNPNDLVFPAIRGGYMHPGTINEALAAVCEQAAIKRITFHGLRHTSGTEQVESGIPITTISERMGHANPSITLNLYVHPDRASHRRAADAIGNRLRRRRGENVVKDGEATQENP